MTEFTVTSVDGKIAILLTPEFVERHRLVDGDKLQGRDTPEGLLLFGFDRRRSEQLEIARGVMEQDREALRRLAD